MIAGVQIHVKPIFLDERGWVKRMLRVDDSHFIQFGEIYFSACIDGAIKAWHRHKTMTLNYMVVKGEVMLAVADLRPGSLTYGKTDAIRLSEREAYLVTIPKGVWNGYRAIPGTGDAIVANCATHPHTPDEIERLTVDEFPVVFNWGAYEVAG